MQKINKTNIIIEIDKGRLFEDSKSTNKSKETNEGRLFEEITKKR